MAMESSRGEESTSWEMWEIMGQREILHVECLSISPQKGKGKEDSGRCDAGEARKNTRSVAAGVFFQGDLGAGKRKGRCVLGLQMMRKGCIAIRDDSWEKFRKGCKKKRNHQNGLEKRRETYEKVTKEEMGRLGIVQRILKKSMDFLRKISAPVGGREVTLPYIPHRNSSPLEDHIWWVSIGTPKQQPQEK